MPAMTGARSFLEAFIPLFIAIDPPGLVPLFVAVTSGLPRRRRRIVSFEASIAAFAISLGFMLLGKALFRFLGINDADFRIAGGLILLVLAIMDILTIGKPAVHESDMVGIVPLAMPLIAGPATLTTVLVLVDRDGVGYVYTGLALLVNFAIVLGAFLLSDAITRLVGNSVMRALSKIIMVFLAAIAVAFIRSGIVQLVKTL